MIGKMDSIGVSLATLRAYNHEVDVRITTIFIRKTFVVTAMELTKWTFSEKGVPPIGSIWM